MAKQVVASHPEMDNLTVIEHQLKFKDGVADASELTAAEFKKLENFGFHVLVVEDKKPEKEDKADKKDEKTEAEDDAESPEEDAEDEADEGAEDKTEAETSDEESELEKLQQEAKDLGIHTTHNMKASTLQKKIDEAKQSESK